MDFLNNLSSFCLHNQGGLERRSRAVTTRKSSPSDFKLGLPGLPPILGMTIQPPSTSNSNSAKQVVTYYCRSCKKSLPTGQNLMWEVLYLKQQASKPQPATPNSAPAGRQTGATDPAKSKREPLPAKLRYDILARDNYRCVKCGASAKNGATLHVDHKKPVAHGGTNQPSNLQTLCDRCNFGKGARQG